MNKIENSSLDITKMNIEKLKELFPNIVTEGKINFDALREILGDEVNDNKEKYQFTWHGKSASIKLAQSPSNATLRPDKKSSKNWDKTRNLYIEGDNLEVLKQLQKTYYGKIKMIYIDPPYNTGNDFVYHDDFKNSIDNYKEQTNQINKSNPETNGRYHTDWLNMMYSRLLLSKNLLKEDGVIFISIDDHEQSNLKELCNEVFGEGNFLAQVVWERAYSPINLMKHFSPSHDYILCYAKNINCAVSNGIARSDEANERYSNPDNDPRGLWKPSDLSVGPAVQENIYPIITPSGRVVEPPAGRSWRLSEKAFSERLQDNRIWFGLNGNNVPSMKRFLSELKKSGVTPMTIWKYTEVDHSQGATQKLAKLFDGKKYFDYPKPVLLLKRCVQLYTQDNDIILDFFSGSATTAHAVMELNKEDGGNRKFIMIQLPELCDEKSEAYKDGYKNICEIGKERIRRAGEQIKTEWEKEHPSDTLFSDNEKFTTDIGFKVFKLDSTNIRPWDSESEMSSDDLFSLSEVFKQDRSKEDILYEIMLKYGIFDMSAEEIEINGKIMYRVGKRYMIVCLEDEITSEDVKAIAELSPRSVVFKESGFKNDNDKINAEYNLEKADVEDVKCI